MDGLADKGSNILRGVIIAILVIFGVYIFARFLLPLLLIAGAGIFLYVKIKGYLNKFSQKEDTRTYNSNINSAKGNQTYDDLDGEVVDVDYKDV